MEWRDEGIILGTRRHGETSAILEVMTRAHGRHLGLVRGGRSRKQQPVLQPGNRVELQWRARLDEHLGVFQVDAIELNAARLFDRAVSVFGLQTIAAHLRLLPERDPHAGLYEALNVVMGHLEEPSFAAELIVRFELMVLEELGFGLDLERCAATGTTQELVAASRGRPADMAGIDAAYRLTGFFLARHVYEPRGMTEPEARAGFVAALRRCLGATGGENAA